MNNLQTKQLMSAIKSTNMEEAQSPQVSDLDTTGAFLSNKDLKPLVESTGSAYTAQNNIKVSTLPNIPEQYDISDTHFDYVSTVKKPYHMHTFTVPTTAGIGDLLSTFQLPKSYFEANTVLKNIGSTFRSFSGKFHLLISVQGSPQIQGALAAVVTYGTGSGYYSNAYNAMCEMNFRHKAILDFSDNSSTADLVIPFRYDRTGIDPFEVAHYVEFRCYSPLIGGGISNISVTISAFVEDPVFRFLRPVEPTRFTQGLLNFTTINNTLSDISNSTLPMHLEGDKLDITPSLMDAVPIALNPTPMLIKYNSINNSNNPFPVERMALNAGAERISDLNTFGTTEDEMDIREILKRDNYLSTFEINLNTPSNSPVYATYVTPSQLWLAKVSEQTNVINRLSSMFKYWRGGLKYKFRFFMNRFQSIKLYAAMFYKDTNPTVLADWSASHGVTLDIGGDQREVEIEIPFNAETSWLYNPTKYLQDLTIDTFQKFALGKLALYTTTPLISPAGSPTSIKCVVTVSVTDDFEFAGYQPATDMLSTSRTQGSIMLSERSKRKPGDIVDCVPSIKNLLKRYFKFSDNYLGTFNVNETFVYANVLFPGSFAYSFAGYDPLTPTNNILVRIPRNEQLTFPRMFSAFRGGLTMRLELAMVPDSGCNFIESVPFDFIPFCLYIPHTSPFNYTDPSTFVTKVSASLESMFLTSETLPSVNTPFIVQPINERRSNMGAVTVFELDCPYQLIEKYSNMDRTNPDNYASNGYIIAGFYSPSGKAPDVFKDHIVNITSYVKFSDDARLGILENAVSEYVTDDSWVSSNTL